MTIDPEKLARAKAREAKRIESEAQEAEKRKKAEIARRKLEKQIETARQFVIGRIVLAALPKMAHEQKAAICRWAHEAGLTEGELKLIPEFAVHIVRETPSLKPAAAEFTRTGK
jgi:hypothetical protein